MAWIEHRGAAYRIKFRFSGRNLSVALKTDDEIEAQGLLARFEENLRLLNRGRLQLPSGADVGLFLLSDGKLSEAVSLPPPERTIGEVFELYRSTLTAGAKEANTLKSEAIHLAHLRRILKSSTPVSQVTTQAIQAYVDRRAKERYRRKPIRSVTIKKEVATLQTVWNWAVRRNHLAAASPVKGITFPKEHERPPFRTFEQIQKIIDRGGLTKAQTRELWSGLFLNLDEVREVLAHVRQHAVCDWLHPFLVTAAHTGARRSELMRARIEDFDPVFVVEGPTCTIAATSGGLSVVGRHSNTGGVELLADLFRDLDPDRPIIILGENDQKPDGSWPGRDGAESVARRLAALLGRSVLKAMPPAEAKDVRDWLISQARGKATWPDRGRELREYLTANAVTVDPPVDSPPSTSTVPQYQPFPVEALPPALREFVKGAAAAVGCDPAFAALPALTLAGAAAGAAVVVSPKRKFREPPALWCCVVADSGTGKSPALKPFADLAFAIDRRMRATYVAELSRYEGELKAWKDANGDPDDKPAKPVREHFAVIDTTIERLAEMLGDSTRGLFLLRDELGGWFGSFTRYKGKGGGSDVPNWLSLFDAGPIRVHRRTGEPRDIEVDRGFISVCGGIQSEILRVQLNDPEYVASGLASRIMFAMPPKACPRWTDVELSDAVERKFTAVLEQFRSIPFIPARGPLVLHLDPAALARFKKLNNEFAERAEGVDGGPMSAVLPKAVRFALRLALVHHLLVNAANGRAPATGVVSLESMQAGEVLARWFVGEAERVYAMLAERPEDRAARGLADLVRRKGGRLRARDLQRSNAGKYSTAAAAEQALDGLVSAGLGEWVVEPPGAKGGAPGKVFVLHPSDTRQNPTTSPPD